MRGRGLPIQGVNERALAERLFAKNILLEFARRLFYAPT